MPTAGWFFGKFEHSLDDKGRVVLPSKIRAYFGQTAYLTPHLEGCLGLWTPEDFNQEVELRSAQDSEGTTGRNSMREWASQVVEAKVDGQGRMAVPGELRTYAGIEEEVLVIGAINRVELWSPSRWETKDQGVGTGGRSSAKAGSSRSAVTRS